MSQATFSLPEFSPSSRGGVLALGNFDGVHRGHQAVIKAALEKACNLGATARVVGDITHASLKVDAGAYVQGVFTRLPADTTPVGVGMDKALPAPGGMAAIAR